MRRPKQIQGVLQGTPQTKTPKITQGVLQSGTFRGTPQRRTPNRTQGVMQGKLRRTPQKRTPKGIQGFFQGTLWRTPQRTQGVLYIFLGVIFLPWFTSSLYILRNIPVVIVFIVMLNDSQLISPMYSYYTTHEIKRSEGQQLCAVCNSNDLMNRTAELTTFPLTGLPQQAYCLYYCIIPHWNRAT